MQKMIGATQARENFAEIINRVLYLGEEFVIKKQGKPVALLTRVKKINKQSQYQKQLTGAEFLLKLTKYQLKGGPKDLAKRHDDYTWK